MTPTACGARGNSRLLASGVGGNPVAIQLPIGAEDQFAGVIDVVSQKAIVWGPGDVQNEGLNYEVTEIPEALKEKAQMALAELIDAVSNKDDTIAEMVLEEKPIDTLSLKAAIRRLTCKIATTLRFLRFARTRIARSSISSVTSPVCRRRRSRPA